MIGPTELARLQPLIAAAGVDGWLLFDFRGRNPIAAAVLGDEIVGSRRVYVLIPPEGPPTALVHGVDAELWRGWPSAWPTRVWVQRDRLTAELGALVRGKRLAVDYSPNGAIPEGDAAARRVISEAGYLEFTVSRTGHSIDRYGLHGFGPPIDHTETCDDRVLIPGVGFSVEPGIYLPGETGARSEVNVVVGEGDIVVTPREYQRELPVV